MSVLSGSEDFNSRADIPGGRKPALRDHLRSATGDAHARLDSSLGALDLRDLDGYRRFLEINAAALLPLEAALSEAGIERIVPDWPLRTRRRAMLDDLAAVGGTFTPLPLAMDLTPDRMLGAAYVLEGSRLGARFLLNTVNTSADPRVTAATAYLSHGAGDRLWPSFLVLLKDAEDTTDHAEAAEGARQTFDLFAKAAGA